eukprot:12978802-Alexandrium_andersonii.AAC.1
MAAAVAHSAVQHRSTPQRRVPRDARLLAYAHDAVRVCNIMFGTLRCTRRLEAHKQMRTLSRRGAEIGTRAMRAHWRTTLH